MGLPRALAAAALAAALSGCGFVGQRADWQEVLPPQRPAARLSDGATKNPYEELFEYTVGKGDGLQIEVAGHPEFSGPVTVDQRGRCLVPDSGEIMDVEGLTLDETEGRVRLALSRYVVGDPEINVRLTASRSKSYYMLGGVHHPGLYRMGANTLRLRDALASAGFFAEYRADKKRVGIITPDEERPTYVIANGRDILMGADKYNVVVKPGDIIFVQDKVIYDLDGFLYTLFRETENASTTNKAVEFWEEALQGDFGAFTYPRQGVTVIY